MRRCVRSCRRWWASGRSGSARWRRRGRRSSRSGTRAATSRAASAPAAVTNETITEAEAFCEEGGGRETADFCRGPRRRKYGPVSAWDVSAVTDMEDLFRGCAAFDQPLGAWKVDQVTSMRGMFAGAAAFDQPLGAWKVDRVTNMYGVFVGAAAFNQPLGAWKVDQVTNMNAMFYGAAAFNQPLGAWKVDQVTSMFRMFCYAWAFNQPLGAWKRPGRLHGRYVRWRGGDARKPLWSLPTTAVFGMATAPPAAAVEGEGGMIPLQSSLISLPISIHPPPRLVSSPCYSAPLVPVRVSHASVGYMRVW